MRGLFRRYNIAKIGFDRWNMRHFQPWLLKVGFSEQFVKDQALWRLASPRPPAGVKKARVDNLLAVFDPPFNPPEMAFSPPEMPISSRF